MSMGSPPTFLTSSRDLVEKLPVMAPRGCRTSTIDARVTAPLRRAVTPERVTEAISSRRSRRCFDNGCIQRGMSTSAGGSPAISG